MYSQLQNLIQLQGKSMVYSNSKKTFYIYLYKSLHVVGSFAVSTYTVNFSQLNLHQTCILLFCSKIIVSPYNLRETESWDYERLCVKSIVEYQQTDFCNTLIIMTLKNLWIRLLRQKSLETESLSMLIHVTHQCSHWLKLET